MWNLFKLIGKNVFWGLMLILILSNSGIPSLKLREIVRVETRGLEFDYVSWTLETIWQKTAQISIGTQRYLDESQQAAVVSRYFELINDQRRVRDTINNIYADPSVTNPQVQAELYLAQQRLIQNELKHVGLLAEAILQHQVSFVASANQLGFIHQPVPPVQYHTTSMPYALIVSPRDIIRQDADISLLPDLSLDQIVALENQVETTLNLSALVVPIGGVGVYPTMVMETSSLNWLSEVVAHEWIHNFLTLRPLGMLYDQSAELRTINETTASIAGKELGYSVIELFYPALLPPPIEETETESNDEMTTPQELPAFDFRAEMHETRLTADTLLEEGKIEDAEAYMEQRRQLFVVNGYNIRRLNQAYFAFHGAYADQPGGAAGVDPVGEAVRSLRAQSSGLDAFLNRIAWVTSFERLQQLIN